MAKILIVVPPLSGHINPTLGLGTQLLKNGHEVAWINMDSDFKNKVPEGGAFFPIDCDIDSNQREKLVGELEDMRKNVTYGIDTLKFLYEEVLIPMNTWMLGGINKVVEDYKPDLIINDHQVFSGAVAALQHNISYVTSVTAPAAIKVNESFPKINEWEGQKVIDFQQKNGIEGEQRLDCSSSLTLVYTSKLFFGDSNLSDNYKFVGPVLNRLEKDEGFDWNTLPNTIDRPKILISIGTTFDHEQKKQFFAKVIEAFENEDITVIIISDPQIFDHIPENFRIYKYIPQVSLMPYFDLVVCHGGHNTVCEAISNGKPLVILPIAYDQSFVTTCVTNNGAGVRLNFNRFKATQLRNTVFSVLDDKSYTENVSKLQKSFKDAGGEIQSVALIDQMLNYKS